MTPARVTVTLGRDGMGTSDSEDDFDSWAEFVSERLATAAGAEYEVTVDVRGTRDVQTDGYSCNKPGQSLNEIRDVISALWVDWCEA